MRAILVMGVSGSGKSTIGKGLARCIGATFLDADDYHPPENIARMAAGQPLTDDMRWPWLDRLISEANKVRADRDVVLACSALRRSYRDHLREGIADLVVAYPEAPRDLIAQRMQARAGHFMPPALLESQFATLEVPTPDEGALTINVDQPVDAIVAQIVDAVTCLFSS